MSGVLGTIRTYSMGSPLTSAQEAVLKYLEKRSKDGHSPPTHREICSNFGYRSPRAATDHLLALERKGYIVRESKRARGVVLVDRSQYKLPLLGRIVAGLPSEAQVSVNEYFRSDPRAFGIRDQSKAFALRIRGDSMIGRGIFDGDIVLLEHDAIPRHGDVVAALIDSESTLKTFIRKDGKTWLRAENPRYPDLIPAWDLRVQGVARAVIRDLNK